MYEVFFGFMCNNILLINVLLKRKQRKMCVIYNGGQIVAKFSNVVENLK